MNGGEDGLEKGLQGQGLDLKKITWQIVIQKRFLNHSLVYFHDSQHCPKSPETVTWETIALKQAHSIFKSCVLNVQKTTGIQSTPYIHVPKNLVTA